MAEKRKSIEDKLYVDKFKHDTVSHIKVDNAVCAKCDKKPCVNACPASVYSLNDKNEIQAAFENCLECGTCRILCTDGSIEWNQPQGGFGVCYRYG